MSRVSKLNLAKAMIVFSLILIFTGVAYNLDTTNDIIDPIKGTYTLNKDDNNVSITTTDTPIINSESPPETANPPNNPSPPPQFPETTIQDINGDLRANIEKKYGITIKYGKQTRGYTVSGLTTTEIVDTNKITQVLTELNNNLATYPSNFFQEIKQGGFTMTLYLVKNYSTNNVTGITDSTYKDVVISIATDYSFAESFHHETYHFIEKYLFYKGARYTTWNSMNPANFTYGNTDNNLSFNITYSPTSAFVNNYAQTDEFEDRASTFEYMTAPTKTDCLQTGTPIWLKAKYISEQLQAVFQTVTPTTIEYWERYIYN